MASKGPKSGVKAPAADTPKPRATRAKAPAAKPVAKAPATVIDAVQAPVAEPAPIEAAKVEETIVEAAPVIETAQAAITTAGETAEPAQKETTVMATQFEAPKVFADFNDRAKAAVEKGTKLVEEFNDFAKGNVEALVESSRITAKGFEALSQDAAEYGRKSFEGFTATLKSLAAAKSPADFFKLQSDYLRTSFDSAVAEASKGTEAVIKLAGDAAQPISNRFAVAAEKVKTAA
ncbi:phasin family protein [Sphingomonas cannabina]|uniref:phasin family protein n=1 Tax=Sphingomonas cannabina TaxID=2899123 RepID=UPI001F4766E2|nr:phasin family protein [Sphingomonas cannabina]UIJ45205.1 phasin family protein [Sphingomonas cannabina]